MTQGSRVVLMSGGNHSGDGVAEKTGENGGGHGSSSRADIGLAEPAEH